MQSDSKLPFVENADSLEKSQLYARIAQILGIPILPEEKGIRKSFWITTSELVSDGNYFVQCIYKEDGLNEALVSDYFTEEQRMKFLEMRGVVVNVSTGLVAVPSFGYCPNITMESIDENPISTVDDYGIPFNFDPKTSKFRVCYDGTIVRVWKFNNEMHITTHRKIDSNNSRWGSSDTFPEIYKELNGPEMDTLFDPEIPSPGEVYIFLMSHPSLLNATKADVGEGWLIFLRRASLSGTPQYWDEKEVMTIDSAGNTKIPIPEPNDGFSPIYHSASFSGDGAIELVNRILRRGYAPEEVKDEDIDCLPPQYRPGEFVIAVNQEGKMIKICPPSVVWRLDLYGNNPNFLSRFYQLLVHTIPSYDQRGEGILFEQESSDLDFHEITKFLPLLEEKTLNSIGDEAFEGKYKYIPSLDLEANDFMYDVRRKKPYNDPRIKRLFRLCYAFAFAVPLHMQADVLGATKVGTLSYASVLIRDRDAVISYISGHFKSLKKLIKCDFQGKRLMDDRRFGNGKKLKTTGKTLTRIVSTAANRANKQFHSQRGAVVNTLRSFEISSIANLIKKERGVTLYGLVRSLLYQERHMLEV